MFRGCVNLLQLRQRQQVCRDEILRALPLACP